MAISYNEHGWIPEIPTTRPTAPTQGPAMNLYIFTADPLADALVWGLIKAPDATCASQTAKKYWNLYAASEKATIANTSEPYGEELLARNATAYLGFLTYAVPTFSVDSAKGGMCHNVRNARGANLAQCARRDDAELIVEALLHTFPKGLP